jgi:hypothetical protein
MKRFLKPCLLVLLLTTICGLTLSATRQPTHHPQQKSSSEKPNPKHDEQQRSKTIWQRTADDPIALYTAMLVGLTGVLALVSIVQIAFLTRADQTTRVVADAARKQAEVAEKTLTLSQRPWLSVEIESVVSMKIFQQGRFELNIKVRTSNVGNTPAIGIILKMEFTRDIDKIEEINQMLGDEIMRMDIAKRRRGISIMAPAVGSGDHHP